MHLADLIQDKITPTKEKTAMLSSWLLSGELSVTELLHFASTQKDSPKATCIEGLEFATQQNPALVQKQHFLYLSTALKEKAPRVKWESAKIIAHTAHLFKNNLETTITNLLHNTEDTGTVVRWSAALALGKIIELKTSHNAQLIPAIQAIINREEKNSIRKIYMAALN
jgi:hypothetical protein